jgi:DNA repair exonuclease SbcCD ATPase subunit
VKSKLVPWIGYPGSTLQNTYAEDLEHGYLVWDIDVKKRRHAVDFVGLPNPRPFVTIEWQGTVDDTFDAATSWPQQSRFRVRSSYALPASDAASLSAKLRKDKQATEIIFKSDDEESAKKFASASLGVDVRSLDAVESMLREYYSNEELDEATWDGMHDALASVHSRVMTEDDTARGTVWTLRALEFDNLYGYGPGNYINFEDKAGIVGIFGPNAIGKSSIVGTIMYALFNTSDRGAGKNAHVVNTRKKIGSARAVVNVVGSDYEIKRQSEKVVSRGLLTANTSLTVKQLDGDGLDLTGEQRPDTEKNLRKLIGNYEDFVVTSGSVQDDVSRFLREGATQRKAILSRFLGIDVFEKVYASLNSELSEVKSKLKVLPSRDSLTTSIAQNEADEAANRQAIVELEAKKIELDSARSEAYVEVQMLASTVEVRKKVAQKNDLIKQSLETMNDCHVAMAPVLASIDAANALIAENKAKLSQCLTWDEMDTRRGQIGDAKLAVQALKADADRRAADVARSKKVTLKLADVPCGDEYPSCAYIKDAHEEKIRLPALEREFQAAAEKHTAALEKVTQLGEDDLNDARKTRKKLETDIVDSESSIRQCKQRIKGLQEKHDKAKAEAEKYTTISLDESDVEQRHLRAVELHKELTAELASVEAQLKNHSNQLGKLEANLAKGKEDLSTRAGLERQSRVRELLVNAFSRRGIPNIVLGKLLPVVNDEMGKILDGVTNFNVTLRAEEDTNALEIFIDDGGVTKESVRPLELGSGMEKMMASLALRVALSNLTTLPKTDFMIIDEGFGSLDPMNAVACVSLLRSLKRFFRFVLIISHVDIIKDAVDCHIDVVTTPDGAQVQA